MQDLLPQYEGQLAPFSFHAGYVSLSYVVSLIGAASALELIRRRTSHKGIHNFIFLAGAAVCMGGIAIWSMHFIGNRAVYILNGEEGLQIAYSTKLTVLSLFVPIFVLLLAFVAVSSNDEVRWWRIGLSGNLSGAGICGMHYLANASIRNYGCTYETAYVVGAALIAVAASSTALALFFVFEAAWTNVWWRRIGCAMVLAGAVSGMHWCAALGTRYRLLHLYIANEKGLSRDSTTIVVICLSVAACIAITITGIYSTSVRRAYASKAQQVALASAVFDEGGRIMVTPDGLLPSEVVTDTFLSKTNSEIFDITHLVFHWMFRASRNWASIAGLVDVMAKHIDHLAQAGIRLVGEDGVIVDNYDMILCELFCLAAGALASRMKERLPAAGTLWDEIFTTGSGGSISSSSRSYPLRLHVEISPEGAELDNLAERGLSAERYAEEYGRGSLLFLVRHVHGKREIEKLEAAGYRFAELHQVVDSIRSRMQIMTPDLGARLRSMAAHSEASAMFTSGVHLGIFLIRARLDSNGGFDILVQERARNLLPSAPLPLERLEPWQIEFLRHFHGLTASTVIQLLRATRDRSAKEARFTRQLLDAVIALREWLNDGPGDGDTFDNATLVSKVTKVPCTPVNGTSQTPLTCFLICFSLVLPIHARGRFRRCRFDPLQFFKVRQLVYPGSPHHTKFSHLVHCRLSSSVLHPTPSGVSSSSMLTYPRQLPGSRLHWASRQQNQQLYGGIMVSRQIVVNVEEISRSDIGGVDATPTTTTKIYPYIVHDGSQDSVVVRDREDSTAQLDSSYKVVTIASAGKRGIRAEHDQAGSAFVDELLALCVEKRSHRIDEICSRFQ